MPAKRPNGGGKKYGEHITESTASCAKSIAFRERASRSSEISWEKSPPREQVQSFFAADTYQEPVSGELFEFLTIQFDLPAGVIVELYRRRWEVKKVFDQMKNKLGQTRAWGTSLTARETQAQMIALTHNLLLGYEQELEKRH